MSVTPQAIKELRERTQAGMSDCKSVLVESSGDMEKAVEIILKKGLAKSAKRAGAVATEGEIRAAVTEGKRAANIVEVNIQTDFAARSDQFRAFVKDVLAAIEVAPAGADHLALPLSGKTVAEIATELTGKIGEKVHVRRWSRVEIPAGKHGLAIAYVHLGGKIGVILSLETGTEEAAKSAALAEVGEDLAMHIAATGPVSLSREEISDEKKAQQKTIFEAQLAEDPKQKDHPERWGKIIEGKFNKWFSESVLLEQESVVTKTNDKGEPLPAEKVSAIIEKCGKALGTTVAIGRFVRFERGEGIEKAPQGDFAAEVAKMAGG
ncbi:MAG: translation elongation factor Ts [Polyangiaceae bacterium]|nr:translation elongation factor Ts [Polyangiaceae bacterium]